MSCWTKPELENMLEDVVNELDLSDNIIEIHGPLGTSPAELVKLVLENKDLQINAFKNKFIDVVDDYGHHVEYCLISVVEEEKTN